LQLTSFDELIESLFSGSTLWFQLILVLQLYICIILLILLLMTVYWV